MKEKKTNLLQVLARRALLVALDGAIVAFSFYFALLLRADGAVEASWWPHNRALLYANLPWIVAVYLLSFLAGRLYTILWKYAGERDLIRLAGMIAVPTGIVYLVNRCFITVCSSTRPTPWRRCSFSCLSAGAVWPGGSS